MAKYNTEFKMKVVKAYLDGEGGCDFLAREYGVSHPSIVRRWVNAYKTQGYDGLKVSRKKKSYSLDFKLNVVKLYLTGEMSYQTLANELQINNPSMITNWVSKYRQEGVEGLRPKKKGKPSIMPKDKEKNKLDKKQDNKEYSQEEIDEIKMLKDQIYWLQMENDIIKKKIELQEKREQEAKKRLK